jgi:hypothetical protein
VNRRHLEYCASAERADIVENEILPWAVGTGELDEFHRGDTYVPCDPDEMPARLRAAGYVDVRVELGELGPSRPARSRRRFRFSAAAPRP